MIEGFRRSREAGEDFDLNLYYHTKALDEIILVSSELDLILAFTLLVLRMDPDLMYGYEPDKGSWFFLFYRGWKNGLDLSRLMARTGVDHQLLFSEYRDFIEKIYICQ